MTNTKSGCKTGCRPINEKRNHLFTKRLRFYVAEREGFEPPVPLGTVVFKTTVIDHSTISPVLVCPKAGAKVVVFLELNKFFGNFL